MAFRKPLDACPLEEESFKPFTNVGTTVACRGGLTALPDVPVVLGSPALCSLVRNSDCCAAPFRNSVALPFSVRPELLGSKVSPLTPSSLHPPALGALFLPLGPWAITLPPGALGLGRVSLPAEPSWLPSGCGSHQKLTDSSRARNGPLGGSTWPSLLLTRTRPELLLVVTAVQQFPKKLLQSTGQGGLHRVWRQRQPGNS